VASESSVPVAGVGAREEHLPNDHAAAVPRDEEVAGSCPVVEQLQGRLDSAGKELFGEAAVGQRPGELQGADHASQDRERVRSSRLGVPPAETRCDVVRRADQLAGEDLTRWGWALLPDQPEAGSVRATWAGVLMRAELEASGGPGLAAIVDFDVGGERFWLRADGERADLRDGPAPLRADVTARCDIPTFTALALGRTDARQAIRSGALQIEGDRRPLERLLRRFRLPARTA
jgi:hypothetical protein